MGFLQLFEKGVELLVFAPADDFIFDPLKRAFQLTLHLGRKTRVGDPVEDIVLFVDVLGEQAGRFVPLTLF
jgi:hypothetical protein